MSDAADRGQDVHKTVLSLKAPSRKGEEGSSSIPEAVQKRTVEESVAVKMREKLISALKIISMATFMDDAAFEDFFSDFGNYITIAKKLSDMKLLSKDVPMDEKGFGENPPDCWMKIIIAIFVALYSFPDNSGIRYDVITYSNAENNAQMRPLGNYFSTLLRLEAYDWNEHKVDVYIPNGEGERTLFLIDDEPALYAIMHSDNSK